MSKSQGLGSIRLSREDPSAPPIAGPVSMFPYAPEGQPMAMTPSQVPSPAGTPNCSTALPALASVYEAHVVGSIMPTGGPPGNHLFVVTDAREFTDLALCVRAAKVAGRWVADVDLKVWGYDPVLRDWAEITVPRYPVACMLHPAACS